MRRCPPLPTSISRPLVGPLCVDAACCYMLVDLSRCSAMQWPGILSSDCITSGSAAAAAAAHARETSLCGLVSRDGMPDPTFFRSPKPVALARPRRPCPLQPEAAHCDVIQQRGGAAAEASRRNGSGRWLGQRRLAAWALGRMRAQHACVYAGQPAVAAQQARGAGAARRPSMRRLLGCKGRG